MAEQGRVEHWGQDVERWTFFDFFSPEAASVRPQHVFGQGAAAAPRAMLKLYGSDAATLTAAHL